MFKVILPFALEVESKIAELLAKGVKDAGSHAPEISLLSMDPPLSSVGCVGVAGRGGILFFLAIAFNCSCGIQLAFSAGKCELCVFF